jgi:predicted ATPase
VGDRLAEPFRHNLPLRLTRLVGRDAVVEEIIEQLSRRRLATVTGPGGIGKSSVANIVAELLVPNYRDGVWLVDLSALASPGLVAASVADVLNIEGRAGDHLGSIIRPLRQKQLLLVLDNCDQVIDGAAAIAVALLKAAPDIHVLATSREALGVEGEYAHKLSPLPWPPSDTMLTADQALRFPAVELFVERAAETLGSYSLSDADAPFVAEICRRLDGIPLAIEFGAARLDAFGVRALAGHVCDHLSLLAGHHRSAAARHQTMHAAVDWSYELLTDEQQQTFQRLGILVGGFSLHAAAAVADDSDSEGRRSVINAVAELVRKSLLTVEIDAPEPQFRLLEPTRSYALQKLEESGEMPAAARRHAQFLLDLCTARRMAMQSGIAPLS